MKLLWNLFRSLLLLATLSLALFVWFGVGLHRSLIVDVPSTAFWMEHAWAAGEQNDFETLRGHISKANIEELYFHVGPLNEDGSLPNDLKLPLPDLPATKYAWMGQLRSEINLEDEAVRAGIVDSADQMLEQGFEGIHINVEPVPRDDEYFITLLDEIRAAHPEAKISVAMDEWQPDLLSKAFGLLINQNIESYWSTQQVDNVAQHVDQLVVMTYDSKLKSPAFYSWWVEQQTIALSNRVPEGVGVRIGIPSYTEGAAIDPAAENLFTGLDGYFNGVSNVRSKPKAIDGIAVYSYWEMSDEDWFNLVDYAVDYSK